MKAELTLDAKTQLGEGSIWDSRIGILWWLDIPGKKLFRFDPKTGENREWAMPLQVGTVVPRKARGLVLAMENGFSFFDPETETFEPIVDPESDIPTNRFNDGKCDPAGRFWAGTMAMKGERQGKGSVYCLYPDQTVQKKISQVSVSNGICWSLDASTLYYIDSPTRRVDAYTFDNETGEISEQRTAIEIPEGTGMPDGMTMDENGNLWVAQWGGYRVACYNPNTGKQEEQIDIPTGSVTSCAFGGDSLETLYVTTASTGFDDEKWQAEPHGGGLFEAQPGVKGIPAFCYEG